MGRVKGHEVQRSVGVADLMLDQVVGDKGGSGVEVERELNVHIRGRGSVVLNIQWDQSQFRA